MNDRAILTSVFVPHAILQPEDDMARRRLQKNGDLYKQGGFWKLRWREDAFDAEGNLKRSWTRPVWIGPAEGKGRLTQKEAQRIAWDNFLSRIDQNVRTPNSVMTLEQFVRLKFVPEFVAMKKVAGKIHYRAMLKHIIHPETVDEIFQVERPADEATLKRMLRAVPGWPYLGDLRLRDLGTDQAQRVVSAVLAAGYSVQTAKHVRNAISAIFSHAQSKSWFTGENPARGVRLPEMVRGERHALSFHQVGQLLAILPCPARDIALCAVFTSMNIAEICGLQWKLVNLTDEWTTYDGEAIPPRSIAVRKQWYRGEYGSLKKVSRKRNIPLPRVLRARFAELKSREKWTNPDDPVLCSRAGTPVDEHNVALRQLKPAGKQIDMPWISWHCFRHTHTTLADQLDMSTGDRVAMMGHADARMTMYYTHGDMERRRTILEAMSDKIFPNGGPIQ